MPYKVFSAGEEALASDANSYLMSQTVPRFTNAAQRTAQLTAPELNQLSMRDDAPGNIDFWNGSAWAPYAGGTWTTFNPTVAGDSGNWTMGNGQCVGRYTYLGPKTITGLILLERQSTTASNAGGIHLSLPKTAAATPGQACIGAAQWFMAPGFFRIGTVLLENVNRLWIMGQLGDTSTNCGILTAAQISAAGNYVQLNFTYEAA